MRKLVVILCAVIVFFCNIAEARSIIYANSDPNYPIWMSGNRGGSALDLSSSIEIPVDNHFLQICARNFSLLYKNGDGETYENGELESHGFVYFREYNDGSGLFYALSDYPTDDLNWEKVDVHSSLFASVNDVYYLVKNKITNK